MPRSFLGERDRFAFVFRSMHFFVRLRDINQRTQDLKVAGTGICLAVAFAMPPKAKGFGRRGDLVLLKLGLLP